MRLSGAGPKTAIATCVKNEGRYLIEWIAWHRLCGFDEIAIYDNDSTDGTRKLLEPLADAGAITLRRVRDGKKVRPQIAAYKAAARRDVRAEWLMIADIDEFLILLDDSTVGEFVARFDQDVSQICLHWRLFGSGGLVEETSEPVIARFTRASEFDHRVNRHVKVILRRSRIVKLTVHAAEVSGGKTVRADGTPIGELRRHGIAQHPFHGIAYINHYMLKSRAEFLAKIARGRGDVAVGAPDKLRSDSERLWQRHYLHDEECLIAKAKLPELEAEMAKLRSIAPAVGIMPRLRHLARDWGILR